ncbi:hypothetical protein PsorP6_012854 [Peronosclerospora sorghi]|uniref:Uncharacterized protein n=1 Tax=Peronosclerospora sorghi TaxID=230839 RepID=A0ACC0WHG6_9STRA|nr:hypothetical protein PsorP6_012854 [Peronosclerospora sorghi]
MQPVSRKSLQHTSNKLGESSFIESMTITDVKTESPKKPKVVILDDLVFLWVMGNNIMTAPGEANYHQAEKEADGETIAVLQLQRRVMSRGEHLHNELERALEEH